MGHKKTIEKFEVNPNLPKYVTQRGWLCATISYTGLWSLIIWIITVSVYVCVCVVVVVEKTKWLHSTWIFDDTTSKRHYCVSYDMAFPTRILFTFVSIILVHVLVPMADWLFISTILTWVWALLFKVAGWRLCLMCRTWMHTKQDLDGIHTVWTQKK